MSALKSEFLRSFVERGYLAQATDLEGLDEAASAGPIVGYIGFDATAPSLHVGSLVQIMLLRRLQQSGHKPIVLLGGGTTRLGDPTGRDEARQLLTPEQISENAAGIRKVFDKFVRFGDGPTDAILVDNADWLLELRYVDFLREYGRHFSVNRMLTFDSVKLRLEREQALSFLEFNYMILQAYDFVELSRRFGCRLQMGGSDQWGNIVNGIELGRRMDTPPLFGLTTPLMTTASGTKMGKTAKGAVWLNADMLSPYDYWQFWRNTEDQDVGRFLRLFTDMPLGEIARLEALEGRELNEAKKILASETTRMAHGAEAAEAAAETARRTFEEGALSDGLPTVDLPRDRLAGGIGILALFTEAGLTASNSEARRFVKDGGLKVNDEIVRDETMQIGLGALTGEGVIKLSLGKKKHVLVRPA